MTATIEAPPAQAPRRGFQPVRDLPVAGWLAALVVVTLIHPWVPAPRWLMLHLLFLGAVSHAIHVWSQYFTDTLLHSAVSAADLRAQKVRLLLHNAGALGVIGGVLFTTWSVSLVGGTLVATAAAWHGLSLARQMRRSLGSRFTVTVRYYVAAAAALVVGATLGVILARDLSDPLHSRVLLAHASVNVLGWVGLTVLGTVLTLWPTMLRTRLVDGAERSSRRALPLLVAAVAAVGVGALTGALPLIAVGMAVYLVGTVMVAWPMLLTARRKPPRHFATLSAGAAVVWLVVVLAVLVPLLATAGDIATAADQLRWTVPALAAGFAAQILLGALSYLVPVALRGGPTPVRAATAVLDRGSVLRVVATNAGLIVLALPVPSFVRILASMIVLAALASFLPLLVLAIRAHRRAKAEQGASAPRARTVDVAAERPEGQLRGLAGVGLAIVVLAVAAGVALDPSALQGAAAATTSAAAGVAPTGATTTVRIEARDMRFSPATVDVPAGNRLVLEVVNVDSEDVHDLVLDTGDRTPRLGPGEQATLDVGVVGRDVEGWCSVAGHRQMGMVLAIRVIGAPAAEPAPHPGAPGHTAHADHAPADATAGGGPQLDPMAEPGPGFQAHDATLPPSPRKRVHRMTFRVQDVVREVAPGFRQTLWTYNGTAPGPVLHGRVGDRFVIRLVNDGSIGHSIDFHAGALAPDRPMRTIPPGKSLVYRFTATKAGVWMYHCSTMPMAAHIANGLFGAVVIEPRNLPPVDRSYVLVQSEYYAGEDGGLVDVDALQAEEPDAVVFNGYANQYAADPLAARVGERVRVWVLDAGPNRATSFHVVGGQFDTVYQEGAYLLRPGRDAGGAQALALGPAQGGFVELRFPQPGTYPFVSHVMVDAERGARGLFAVE